MLTGRQRHSFALNGYAIVDDMLSPAACAELTGQAYRLIEQADLSEASRFSTTERSRIDNDYFLGSAETIRCFFEDGAFDEAGRLSAARERSINKIGHALHDLDPVFRRLARRPDLGELARTLGLVEPYIYQSMLIFKQPRIGGEVTWHQDASFFLTEPSSVVTFWFALEEATLENGCLWVEPGGHTGPLRERYCREGRSLSMVPLDDRPWPTREAAQPVPVAAGSLLVFHGHLPHYSAANRSERSRLALTFHVVDGRCTYAADNWLQRPRLGRFSMSRPDS